MNKASQISGASAPFAAGMENVSFSYDGKRTVIRDASLALEKGKAYALVGPNGAGKSTIVGLLSGRLEPRVGRVMIEGHASATERKKRTATVQQQLSLFPHLSVADNLLLGFEDIEAKERSKERAHELARTLLGAIGANLPLDVPCGSLPFASRQKIEIARALSRRPAVLCLDEPTSALDRSARNELHSALRRIRAGGTTVILVTHDSGEVDEIEATPIYVYGSRIVGSPQQSVITASDLGSSPRRTSSQSAEAFDIRFASRLNGGSSTVLSVTPGMVTLALFDDALNRSDSVQSFFGKGEHVVSSIRVSGHGPWRELPGKSFNEVIRIVSSGKHDYCAFPSLTTQENAVLLAGGPVSAFRSKKSEAELLSRLRQRAGIEYPSPDSCFTSLSGGNQQRLILAALLESSPGLLVVEEPLMGVDERSFESISGLLWKYASDGGRVLVTTCFPDTYQSWEATRVHLTATPTGNSNDYNVLS